jgi:hypothetical protein
MLTIMERMLTVMGRMLTVMGRVPTDERTRTEADVCETPL